MAAREHHRRSLAARAVSDQEMEQRNRLIRQLREEDPERWSYGALAAAVGISRELAKAIVNGRVGGQSLA
jgi:hypothetical protein